MSSQKAHEAYISSMDKNDVITIKDEILKAALPNVVFDGWHWDVIVQACEDAGHSENTARGVFPGKMVDVLDHFADYADREMLAALEGLDPESLRVRDRVKTALMMRFEKLMPYKDAVRQSLQFWIVPTRKPRAMKITWRTADKIWDWAGDPSSPGRVRDYNHYTKRGLLSGVIAATTLAWLNDSSEDMEQTREFLDRRIENVMQLGKVVSKFKKRGA